MNQYNTSNPEDKKKYRKLKHYWKLLLKNFNKLDYQKYEYHRLFKGYKFETEVIDYLVSLDSTLQDTYRFYQSLLLYAIHQNDYEAFIARLNAPPVQLSHYMKASSKTLKNTLQLFKILLFMPFQMGRLKELTTKLKSLNELLLGLEVSRVFVIVSYCPVIHK